MSKKWLIILGIIGLIAVGVIILNLFMIGAMKVRERLMGKVETNSFHTDFYQFHPVYRFSAELPAGWQAEFIPEITAINLYDPGAGGATNLEKSRIFIRYFEANDFLTLATVNIISHQADTINDHPVVRYEIEKKPNVPTFPYQPYWRNSRHKLVDVRFSQNNPTTFFVFAYNPVLSENNFLDFIRNIKFHNDPESFQPPLPDQNIIRRVTKKPFGLYVAPENSPVDPERFTGYHSGTDFETFPEEADVGVPVYTICGGPLRSRRTIQGYGGVITQECILNDQLITVIYGHISISNTTFNGATADTEIAIYLGPGTFIGILGRGYSPETNGERKHLHLGIKKGITTDIRGYVQNQTELDSWVNPMTIVSK